MDPFSYGTNDIAPAFIRDQYLNRGFGILQPTDRYNTIKEKEDRLTAALIYDPVSRAEAERVLHKQTPYRSQRLVYNIRHDLDKYPLKKFDVVFLLDSNYAKKSLSNLDYIRCKNYVSGVVEDEMKVYSSLIMNSTSESGKPNQIASLTNIIKTNKEINDILLQTGSIVKVIAQMYDLDSGYSTVSGGLMNLKPVLLNLHNVQNFITVFELKGVYEETDILKKYLLPQPTGVMLSGWYCMLSHERYMEIFGLPPIDQPPEICLHIYLIVYKITRRIFSIIDNKEIESYPGVDVQCIALYERDAHSVNLNIKNQLSDTKFTGPNFKLIVEVDLSEAVKVLYMGDVYTLRGTDMVLYNPLFTSQDDNYSFLIA